MSGSVRFDLSVRVLSDTKPTSALDDANVPRPTPERVPRGPGRTARRHGRGTRSPHGLGVQDAFVVHAVHRTDLEAVLAEVDLGPSGRRVREGCLFATPHTVVRKVNDELACLLARGDLSHGPPRRLPSVSPCGRGPPRTACHARCFPTYIGSSVHRMGGRSACLRRATVPGLASAI